MTTAITAGIATLMATFFALWSVTLTSNHYRVRRHLWAHVTATSCGVGYMILFGEAKANGPYYWLYVLTNVPILVTALLIAYRMVKSLRYHERKPWICAPALVAAVVILTSPLDTRVRVFLAVQGAVLALAGLQALSVALLRRSAPYVTLGGLWLTQAMLFTMYARGVTLNAGNWQWVGDWLPAAIVSGGMVKLAFDYFLTHNLEQEA